MMNKKYKNSNHEKNDVKRKGFNSSKVNSKMNKQTSEKKSNSWQTKILSRKEYSERTSKLDLSSASNDDLEDLNGSCIIKTIDDSYITFKQNSQNFIVISSNQENLPKRKRIPEVKYPGSSTAADDATKVRDSSNILSSNEMDHSNSCPYYGFLNNDNLISNENSIDQNTDGEPQSVFSTNYNAALTDKYFSICSNAIQSCNISKISDESEDEDNRRNALLLRSIFLPQKYIIFFFEVENLMIWAYEKLKSLYPELNLILYITIDDDISTQEKIHFKRDSHDKIKLYPLLEKRDLINSTITNPSKKVIMILRQCFIQYPNISNDSLVYRQNTDVHKISLKLFTYINNLPDLKQEPDLISDEDIELNQSKLVLLSCEDIYLRYTLDSQMHKVKFYKNMQSLNDQKKIANLSFNFAYKIDHIKFEDFKIHYNFYYNLFINNLDSYTNYPTSNLVTSDDSINMFLYKNSKNTLIKKNGGSHLNNNFFSVDEIEYTEISGELKSGPKIDRLLELLSIIKYKYDLIEVLRQTNMLLFSNEFDDGLLFTYKNLLLNILQTVLETKSSDDNSFIVFLLKICCNTFFKKCKKRHKKNVMNSTMTLKGMPELEDSFSSLFSMESESTIIKLFNFDNLELMKSLYMIVIDIIDNNSSIEEVDSVLGIIVKLLLLNKFRANEQKQLSVLLDFVYQDLSTRVNQLCGILFNFQDSEQCTINIIEVLYRMSKRNQQTRKVIFEILQEDKYMQGLRNILCNFTYNSNILTSLFALMSTGITNFTDKDLNNIFQRNSIEQVDHNPKNLNIYIILKVISLEEMKKIYLTFQQNHYDVIHESILGLVREYLIRENKENSNNSISKSDLRNIIIIYNKTFSLIKHKLIQLVSKNKLNLVFINFFTTVYQIVNIMNNIKINILDLLDEFSCIDDLIDFLYCGLYETKVPKNFDFYFENDSDVSLIQSKTILFRCLHHVIILVKKFHSYKVY